METGKQREPKQAAAPRVTVAGRRGRGRARADGRRAGAGRSARARGGIIYIFYLS